MSLRPGRGSRGPGWGHLPECKDVRVLGEGELVFLRVRRQLADNLWRQVTQPAILDAQLVLPPGEAKHGVSLLSQPSLPAWTLSPWTIGAGLPASPGWLLPDPVLEAETQWEMVYRETCNTQTSIRSLCLGGTPFSIFIPQIQPILVICGHRIL